MDTSVMEMLRQIRAGEESAFTHLAEQYAPLTESMTAKYAAKAGLRPEDTLWQDLKQEAGLALYRAALTYDGEQKDVSFGLYAKVCVRNALISGLRGLRKLRRTREDPLSAETEDRKSPAGKDPLNSLVSREETKALYTKIAAALSGYEAAVFDEYIVGKSPKEIARTVGRPVKSVNNAVCRIKTKLKGLLRK